MKFVIICSRNSLKPISCDSCDCELQHYNITTLGRGFVSVTICIILGEESGKKGNLSISDTFGSLF